MEDDTSIFGAEVLRLVAKFSILKAEDEGSMFFLNAGISLKVHRAKSHTAND